MPDKLARICWNNHFWTKPSGREGKSTNPQTHEFRHGFGWEEWLLDITKLVGGFHYGFVQAVPAGSEKRYREPFNLSLYTINGETKQRLWVGEILNLKAVSHDESRCVYEEYEAKGWLDEMRNDLHKVGATVELFEREKPECFFTIKYLPHNLNLMDPPRKISRNDRILYLNRYAMYSKETSPDLVVHAPFCFNPGHRTLARPSQRVTYKDTGYVLSSMHAHIQDALYEQLVTEHGAENVGTEQLCCGNSIDVVVKKGDLYSLYEIKTSHSAKRCIREALGQLLEYAHFAIHSRGRICNLVIVSPYCPSKSDEEYLAELKKQYNLPLEYKQVKPEFTP